MQLNESLIPATFIKRPNRFLVYADYQGQQILAHLADPGRLQELLLPGARLLLRSVHNTARKTAYTVMFVEHNQHLVSVNSTLPNQMVLKSLQTHSLPGLETAELIKAEYALGSDRYDFLVHYRNSQMIIEVKGVSLVENGIARFPDAVTDRGRRHLEHLQQLQQAGTETAVYFVIQRDDATRFEPNWERDPKFAQALIQAAAAGVKVFAHSCSITPNSMEWYRPVEVHL